MINFDAQYLRSQRTLTAAQVDAQGKEHDRFSLTPADRLDNATSRTVFAASQH